MKIPRLKSNNRLAGVILRAGLAAVFLYASVAELRNPGQWVFFLPSLLVDHFPVELLLRVFAILQLGLAVWLISGWRIHYAAGIAALLLAGIVVANPSTLDITFRDVGLTFMALALAFLEK